MVSKVGSVLRNCCFGWSGGFSNVGQATWAFEHIHHIVDVACYDPFDIERFSCLWVIKSSSFVCEVALWVVTISVIAMTDSL